MEQDIDKLSALILTQLEAKGVVSLREIAEEAHLSAKSATARRALQRAFAHLIKVNAIEAQGKARARVYILKKNTQTENNANFKGIELSKESSELIKYISAPITTRKIVSYNQDFLRSYQPNKSSYLSSLQKKALLKIGTVENIIRPAGTYARNILNRLLIDLSWNSSRLEGNTYSLLETKRLIEVGENAPNKDIAEAQMILNHKHAIEYIIESCDQQMTSSHDIRSIHALLSDNLLGDPGATGRLREIAVNISGTTYLPLDNPHVLKELFDLFIQKLNLIEDPFEKSFFSLVHLSYLQAFEDINKRTSRLAANISLIKQNLTPLSFIDVNQSDYVISLVGLYEKTDVSLMRDLYMWAYNRSAQRYSALQQSIGEPDLLKIKHRNDIQLIVKRIIIEKITGDQLVPAIKKMIDELSLSEVDSARLFTIIETEIINLHDGNIARFKILPSEYQQWLIKR